MSLIDVCVRKTLVSDSSAFELDVTFQSDSRRIVLLGPSGAGKSLTLRLIAGLIKPDAGRIVVDGQVYVDKKSKLYLPASERETGFLFQDYALFPHLTVRQNVAFGLHRGLLNPSKRESAAQVVDWIQKFELEAVALNYPHQISGGQKQRVALARALVARPRILLLDEPFAALDQDLRARMREEVSALQTELNIPMITITHDQQDAEVLGDHVIRLSHGRVQG